MQPLASRGLSPQPGQLLPQVGGGLFIADERDQQARTQRAIAPEAIALWSFSALAGFAMLLALGQIAARRVFLDGTEFPTLRTLGMTRPTLVAVSMAKVAGAALVGALLAVGIAVAASPLMPIGRARVAEPNPGLAVNVRDAYRDTRFTQDLDRITGYQTRSVLAVPLSQTMTSSRSFRVRIGSHRLVRAVLTQAQAGSCYLGAVSNVARS